ncbi:MAG: pirin family protein [Betaproteobacteria bacterium]|nr:pirin family protein [Betaproteobacteria bacterium]MDH3438351.1 pirin family protein [Betaproteobacteria bacterium]
MITLRKAHERGHANHGWLDTWHTFSFADYHDPREMGFGPLRVINDDTVEPGQGFGTHGHRDMEIITYVLEGALEHKDSMGNGSIIRPGNVQRMSAGTGVRHSEFNPSRDERGHLLQIWIEPKLTGVAPSYEEKQFGAAAKRGQLCLIASPDGRDGSVTIHQDAFVYAALLDDAERVIHALAPGRRAYVHVARGSVELNGNPLKGGDGAKITGERELALSEAKNAEVLLFDLA